MAISPKQNSDAFDPLAIHSLNSQQESPSIFKPIFFDPLVKAIRWLAQAVFQVMNRLRDYFSYRELACMTTETDRSLFESTLHSMPRGEELIRSFERLYLGQEKNRVYEKIGREKGSNVWWKNLFYEKTFKENIEAGRSLVRNNPLLLREYL